MIIQIDKTIINGGDPLTAERLNGYYLEDNSELANRIKENYPNIDLVITNGQLTDVNITDPAIRPPTPPTEIELLQIENAMISLELIETQIRLDAAEAEQANLLLELVDRGVL